MIDLSLHVWNEILNHLNQKSIYTVLMHGRTAIEHKTLYEFRKWVFIYELAGNIMIDKSNFELP